MFNPVLWTLDKETDPFIFERLCSDLMYRNGYKDIVPLGKTYDRGRDAETNLYRGKEEDNQRVFFQYSLRKDWEKKLNEELEKVKKYGHQIDKFIFVTTQDVTGNKMDKLKIEVKNNYGWNLKIYHREWLRLQLEEANKDLAHKYLGVPDKYLENSFEKIVTEPPKSQEREKAWKLYLGQEYEKAIPKLKDLLGDIENDKLVYNAIAGSYYNLYNYKEALKYINYSLEIDSESSNALVIKGCILAEDGIANNSKPKLILAKGIFERLVTVLEGWVIYYNLANTLSALGEYEEAKDYYLKALKYNQNDMIWKNLGTCYYQLKNHEKEIECFDKALELNPSNVEALVSKGVTLALVFNEYKEGLGLLDIAIEKGERIAYRWPHIWYWKTKFLIKINDYIKALKSVNKGLEIVPDYKVLMDLKSFILSELWKNDKQFIEEAKKHYKYRLEIYEKDINVIKELSLIYKKTNEEKKAFEMLTFIINNLSGIEKMNVDELKELNLPFKELLGFISNINLYCSFREYQSIENYFDMIELELSDNVKKVLWIVWGMSFSQILKTINAPIMVNVKFIKKLYYDVMNIMGKHVCLIAKQFAKNYRDVSDEEKITFLSYLLTYLPEIMLREFSSQIGYLAGRFNFNSDLVDIALIGEGEKLANWLKDQIYPILSSANMELELLQDD